MQKSDFLWYHSGWPWPQAFGGKKTLCDHSGLRRPLGFERMSYDPFQGTIQMKGKVMGYSIIYLSRRRLPSKRVYTSYIWQKVIFKTAHKSNTHRFNTLIGIPKRKCVYVWDCECVCMCVCDEKQGIKKCVSRRKKKDLCLSGSLGQWAWDICIFGVPARGHIQTRAFLAHILSCLSYQLTALSAVSY